MRKAVLLGAVLVATCLVGCGQGSQGEKGDAGPAGPPAQGEMPGLPGRKGLLDLRDLRDLQGRRGRPGLLVPLRRRYGSCSRIALQRVAPPNAAQTKCSSRLTAAPEEHRPCSRASGPPPVEHEARQVARLSASAQRCQPRTTEQS